MVYLKTVHREVLWIAGGKPGSYAGSGRRDQAIGLMKRNARLGEVSSPRSSLLTFGQTKRCDPQTPE